MLGYGTTAKTRRVRSEICDHGHNGPNDTGCISIHFYTKNPAQVLASDSVRGSSSLPKEEGLIYNLHGLDPRRTPEPVVKYPAEVRWVENVSPATQMGATVSLCI